MNLVSIFALAAASSVDCFVIGLNYGVKGVRISRVSNCFIALVCFLGTYASMLAGRAVRHLLDPAWSTYFGGFLFVLLGLYMLRGALSSGKAALRRHYSENPEAVDKDASNVIELRESLLIGFLLCVNNIGIGIGGGIAGLSILLTPVACGLFSFLLVFLGHLAGQQVANRRLAALLELASSCLILLLGLWELRFLASSLLSRLVA